MSQGGSAEGGQIAGSLWDAQPWVLCSNFNNSLSESDHKAPIVATSCPIDHSFFNSPISGTTGKKRARDDDAVRGSSSKSGGSGSSEGKAVTGNLDHEMHIWTERERRKKMRNMFTKMHALLPQLPSKADKLTIVDEAINYIKTLQQNLQKLQKQKLERMWAPPVDRSASAMAVALQSTHGMDQFMSTREAALADHVKSWPTAMSSPTSAVSIARFPNCFQTWSSPNVVLSVSGEDAHISICAVKKPEVLSTVLYVLEKHNVEVVSASISSDLFRTMFMIHAHASRASDQFPEALMIEEIYKSAVGEIALWLS